MEDHMDREQRYRARDEECEECYREESLARHRRMLRGHLTLVQPAGAPRFDIDDRVGIDVDAVESAGRPERHRMVVREVHVRATGHEALDDLGIWVAPEGSVEVTYSLEILSTEPCAG
jgi:hypothetical protein